MRTDWIWTDFRTGLDFGGFFKKVWIVVNG